MNFPSREYVEKIRSQYPVGTRVSLVRMNDVDPVAIGTKGTVKYVDDAGTIHVTWDDGRTLGVVLEDGDMVEKIGVEE